MVHSLQAAVVIVILTAGRILCSGAVRDACATSHLKGIRDGDTIASSAILVANDDDRWSVVLQAAVVIVILTAGADVERDLMQRRSPGRLCN